MQNLKIPNSNITIYFEENDDLNRMEEEGTVWKPHGTSPWLFKATAFA